MALIRSASSPSPDSSGSPSSPAPEKSLTERVSGAYDRLTQAAAVLNAVSDELNRPIEQIELALKKLNTGVSTWVVFEREDNDEHDRFFERSLGYAEGLRQVGLPRSIAGWVLRRFY